MIVLKKSVYIEKVAFLMTHIETSALFFSGDTCKLSVGIMKDCFCFLNCIILQGTLYYLK